MTGVDDLDRLPLSSRVIARWLEGAGYVVGYAVQAGPDRTDYFCVKDLEGDGVYFWEDGDNLRWMARVEFERPDGALTLSDPRFFENLVRFLGEMGVRPGG